MTYTAPTSQYRLPRRRPAAGAENDYGTTRFARDVTEDRSRDWAEGEPYKEGQQRAWAPQQRSPPILAASGRGFSGLRATLRTRNAGSDIVFSRAGCNSTGLDEAG